MGTLKTWGKETSENCHVLNTAQDDPCYMAQGADGLYHCLFDDEEYYPHQTTKLKASNKYVDFSILVSPNLKLITSFAIENVSTFI